MRAPLPFGSSRAFRDLQTGDEAFEIALLFRLEIARHYLFRCCALSVVRSVALTDRRVRLIRPARRSASAPESSPRRLRLVGHVDGKPGEGEAADQIAERDRNLIPQPPIGDRDFRAHHHAGRNDEHVDDGVLEALREEDEDRHPGAGDLADGRSRRHGEHHGEADHPVAQHRLDEDGDHAGKADRGIADGLGFGGLHDARGDAGRRGRAHIGERDGEQGAIGDAADQIADEDPAPVDEHRAGARFAIEPRQRHQRKTSGYEFEAEQHDAIDADREDQRADQRQAGLHRAGEGEAGRDAENGARQHAADQKVARRQRELAPAGFEHRARATSAGFT